MTTWSLLLVLASGCEVERPGVGSERYEQPAFSHASLTAADECASCHVDDRPADFAGEVHGANKDCRTCHAPKDDHSGWLPRLAYSHDPVPETCFDCHIKERPERKSHPAKGECAGCHDFPDWPP